jgi:arsenite methyltransferase
MAAKSAAGGKSTSRPPKGGSSGNVPPKGGPSGNIPPAGALPGGLADYGLDSPFVVRSMYSRATWTFAFGFALWFMNRVEYPGPAASLLGALSLIAAVFVWAGYFMTWSSRTGKLRLRDRLVAMLALNGDEKVLDAGCGRGLMSVGIAKRMKTGKVTAVDVWDPRVLSGNSADAARANAKKEGVGERIRFEEGDLRKLVYPAENFDLVFSGGALHFFEDEPDRDQAVRELLRVLKPGGRLMIGDTKYTGRYMDILRESGAGEVWVKSVGFLWCHPVKSVAARK